MAYLFCNRCGHRNPPASNFCSSCGTGLDSLTNQTITLPKIDADTANLVEAADAAPTRGVVDAPSSGPGQLVVQNGPQTGERFVLEPVLTRLGRSEDNEISLDDITVSRRHAEITCVAQRYVVRDLGSLNGTYVNASRIDESALRSGDEVQVGKFRLLFVSAAAMG